MPDFNKLCFKPSLSTAELTHPSGFRLRTDERGALHEQRLEDRLSERGKEEMSKRVFRAQPIMQTTPFKEIRPQTPRPRTPKKDNLSAALELAERAKQEVDGAESEQIPVFRARPCPTTTYRRGTLPERTSPPVLTVPMDPKLSVDQRHCAREMFEMERQQRALEAEERRRQAEEERRKQEARELSEQRKAQTFKARDLPMTTYTPAKLPEKQVRTLTCPS